MRKAFDDKIGMSVLEKGEILVKDIVLREELKYQRAIQEKRLDKLRTSYEKHGYLQDKRIVLNPRNEPVEGQHRTIILRENGIKKVDYIRYSYDTPEDEWKHFCLLNNWNPTLGTKDDWHAKLGSGDPIARILYQLNTDETSALRGNIFLRGCEGKYKFPIPQVLLLINYSLGVYRPWSRERERISYERLAHFDYNNIRQTIHHVLGWFNAAFGLPSESTVTPYKATTFRVLIRFYRLLEVQHKLRTDKSKEASIKRMGKFDFTEPSFLKANEFTRLINLVGFYNRKAHKKDYLRLEE